MTDLEVIEENIKYAWCQGDDFENGIHLLPDESIELNKRVLLLIKGKLINYGIPGFVVLTNRRIIFLLQYYSGPTKLLYIPLNAISGMTFKNLGIMRGSQRAISLEYNNNSIVFLLSHSQYITGLSDPNETLDFYKLLKEKLPECRVDETYIPTDFRDYYLFLASLVIGLIIGSIIGGFIGGLLGIFLFGAIGGIVGKLINTQGK